MKCRRWMSVVGVTVLSAGVAFGQLLPPASDDVKLRITQQEFDEDAAGRAQKAHAEAMANQFQVEPQAVENLRTSKQGWGEIAIRMGLAQELVKTDPKTYPSMTEALKKVGDLRAQKMSWGEIAKSLGFQLGPVVSGVQRVRQEMRAAAKKAATEGVVMPGKVMGRAPAGNAPNSDRLEKTQQPEKPERAGK